MMQNVTQLFSYVSIEKGASLDSMLEMIEK